MRRAALVSLALLVAACGKGGGSRSQAPATGPAGGGLEASTASYDLAVGPPSRFLVGAFDRARGGVAYGTVQLRFSFLGEKKATGTPRPGPTATGAFLPIPGSPEVAAPAP